MNTTTVRDVADAFRSLKTVKAIGIDAILAEKKYQKIRERIDSVLNVLGRTFVRSKIVPKAAVIFWKKG